MKDATHLIRLAAVVLGGLLLFLLVRAQVVPPGFGRYGHFRAGALDDARNHPLRHAGKAACASCHEDPPKTLASGKHAGVACESCHGPLANHAEDPGKATPARPDTAVLCARCHRADAAKPKGFPQVDPREHYAGDACGSCHQAHTPSMK